MNSGKTIEVLRTHYNYLERGLKVLLIKPSVDLKGNDSVVSRIGVSKKVDYVISPELNLFDFFFDKDVNIIIADEAQFFSREQIDQLWKLCKIKDIDILCYGLRTDFMMNGFPGSTRLLELADSISELKTICGCGKKATINMRLVDGKAVFEGEQVSIDGFNNVTYDAVCGNCYIEKQNK